ncbi:MAG: hypothetical protein WAL22_00135 [Solirubrobacteraceae bacterium]
MLLLITGASGVGKSTTRALVAGALAAQVDCVELGDLAPLPTAVTRQWRQQTAELAVDRAVRLQASGRHLLLAGDPVPAVEIVAAPSASQLDAIAVCLLDASAEVQAARLTARGDDPTLLVHHRAFADWMRQQARDPLHMLHVVSDQGWDQMRWERVGTVPNWSMHTIDTSRLDEQEVADAVLDWCRRALAGAAPILQVDPAPVGPRDGH